MKNIDDFVKGIIFLFFSTILISVHSISTSILLQNNIRYVDDYFNNSTALFIGIIFLIIGLAYIIKNTILKLLIKKNSL